MVADKQIAFDLGPKVDIRRGSFQVVCVHASDLDRTSDSRAKVVKRSSVQNTNNENARVTG